MRTRRLAAELRVIFGALPGAYLLLSPQLRVELVSAGYHAAVPAAWPRLQVGQDMPAALEALPAGQCLARKLRASLAQVLLTGQPHEVACRRTCQLPSQEPDGLGSWQLASQPIRDAAGAVRYLLCQLSVAPAALPAAPAAALAAAPASEGSLAEVLAQLPVALCLLRGPRHEVELLNPLAAQVWGLPAAEALGRPFLDLLPEAVVASYAAACAAVWHSGQAVRWPELPVAGLTAELAYLTLSFQPFQPSRGGQAGILLVAQNITPLLQARQQAQQLQAELTATTAGLADYVAELLRASASTG